MHSNCLFEQDDVFFFFVSYARVEFIRVHVCANHQQQLFILINGSEKYVPTLKSDSFKYDKNVILLRMCDIVIPMSAYAITPVRNNISNGHCYQLRFSSKIVQNMVFTTRQVAKHFQVSKISAQHHTKTTIPTSLHSIKILVFKERKQFNCFVKTFDISIFQQFLWFFSLIRVERVKNLRTINNFNTRLVSPTN